MIRRSCLIVAGLVAAPLARGLAQCASLVTSVSNLPGIRGQVLASTAWDPDGPGPAGTLVVFTGDFRQAGPFAAVDVVAYDPATRTWIEMPGLANPDPSGSTGRAVAVLANGDLILGGSLRLVGATNDNALLRWTGSSWQPFGGATFFGGSVHTLLPEPNGDLLVGGDFQQIGKVARWNGSSWSGLGGAFASVTSTVQDLVRMPNGDLVASGNFTSVGGVPTKRIARWNGVAWSALGAGLTAAPNVLLPLPNGDLVVGGQFVVDTGLAGAPQNLARWDGTSWSGFAGTAAFLQSASSLFRLPNGDLLVSGSVTAGNFVQRWNGGSWTPYPGPNPGLTPRGAAVTMTQMPTGDLILAGGIVGDAGTALENVVRSDGTSWQAPNSGLTEPILSLGTATNGDVYAGCEVGVSEPGVFRLRDGVWSGLPGIVGSGLELAVAQNGDLVAYTQGSGMARWNGSSWQSLNAGLTGFPQEIQVEANGDLVCCGSFTVAGGATCGMNRRSGSAWTPFAPGLVDLRAFVRMPNGDYVGANNSQIARWNGSQWLPLGWPTAAVSSLAVSPAGVLFAGGGFVVAGGIPANGVARWNGTIWQAVGSGVPYAATALAFLPDGDLLVAGSFDLGGTGCRRWNGSAWSLFGAPPPLAQQGAQVAAIAVGGRGVLLGGRWNPFFGTSTSDPTPSVQLATSTCPATVLTTGSGCVGSAGPVVLQANAMPWLGGAYRAQATGLPASSLAIDAWGTAGLTAPLAGLLAAGQANCDLLVAPDVLGVLVPTSGQVATSLPIPDAVGLLGAVLRHQILPFEFGPSGDLVAVTASNGLVVTVGDL